MKQTFIGPYAKIKVKRTEVTKKLEHRSCGNQECGGYGRKVDTVYCGHCGHKSIGAFEEVTVSEKFSVFSFYSFMENLSDNDYENELGQEIDTNYFRILGSLHLNVIDLDELVIIDSYDDEDSIDLEDSNEIYNMLDFKPNVRLDEFKSRNKGIFELLLKEDGVDSIEYGCGAFEYME